jgi:hypothetical protein
MIMQPPAGDEAPPDTERQHAFAEERRAVEIAFAEIVAARYPGTVWTPLGDDTPDDGDVVVRLGGARASRNPS